MNDTFTATVEQEAQNTIVHLSGVINRDADQAINAAYDEAAGANPDTIVLNFSSVEYINSTGIALIVGLLAKARVSGCKLSALGLTDHYREIFKSRAYQISLLFSNNAGNPTY